MPPRLLFLCQTLPFPPDGGVQIRTYNVLRLLARAFDTTALCFYRSALQMDVERSVAALRELAHTEAFPIPQEHHPSRLVLDHLQSLLRSRVYTVDAYCSRPFRRRLEELLRASRFDVVHVDSLDLSAYLPRLSELPVACTHHNVESELLRRRARVERNPLRAAYLAHQARLMESEERTWCERVALNLTVSEDDRSALRRIAPGGSYAVVPNGVDVERLRPDFDRPVHGIVYVGGTTWFPNRDALEHLASDILPLLRDAGERATVTWVGRASAEEKEAYRGVQGLVLTGYVEDVRPHDLDAACYAVPLRVGGGTRLKILEAWALGKAVVSTSVGCEGLEAVDDENVLIRDDPREFARAVRRVLHDAPLRQRLGRAARRTAERSYGWDVIGRTLVDAYARLIDTATSEDREVTRLPA